MDRRTFINAFAGGLVIARSVAEAQQAARIPRIGFLAGNLSAGQHSQRPSVKGCMISVTSRAATS